MNDMKFRPCIDIHNGQVKQIVGGSLSDIGNEAQENFVSTQDAVFYANLYKKNGLKGGHIILLNPQGSEHYNEDVKQALGAMKAYPGGLQIGGGIDADNALYFLEHGASHVIVTSYVFRDGQINYKNLEKIKSITGREHLVLDLSCRKRDNNYVIVTDRWQNYTNETIDERLLDKLAVYCDEFLIHAVDVEGKASGIETDLARLLGKWDGIPITYAGGVGSYHDLNLLRKIGNNKLDVTIGSALDLFGGTLKFNEVLELCAE